MRLPDVYNLSLLHSKVDADGSGVVEFDEFVKLMVNTPTNLMPELSPISLTVTLAMTIPVPPMLN